MQIRRAEATDEEALARIRRSAILVLAAPAMSMEQAGEWATQAAADRIARAIRDHDVWVAVEGAAIGWVEVDRDRVAALYVSPSCSRRGVGSAMLARAETSIRSFGYAMARLESSQNALDFYLRRGYVRYGPPDVEGAYPLCKDLAAAGPNQGQDAKLKTQNSELAEVAPAAESTPFILVLTGTSSRDEAQAIADAAIEQRLAAAAQVIGPATSTYRWEGQVTHAEEWLCLLKTSAPLYERVEQIIRSLHSYKLPGILAIPVAAGSAPYLAWFAQALQQAAEPAPHDE